MSAVSTSGRTKFLEVPSGEKVVICLYCPGGEAIGQNLPLYMHRFSDGVALHVHVPPRGVHENNRHSYNRDFIMFIASVSA